MPSDPDAALHALLDTLGAPPTTTRAASVSPGSRSAHAAPQAFGRENLPDALAAANSALAAAGASTRLPQLANSSAAAAQDALAAALGVVVRLARACEAGGRLRREAEARAERAEKEAEGLQENLRKARERVKDVERKVVDVERRAARTGRRGEEEKAGLVKETGDLRGRLAAVVRREGVLVFEGRRRDKEYGKLQARVHNMLANRDAVRPPIVRIVAGREDRYAWGEDGRDSDIYEDAERWPRLVQASYEERHEALVGEGEEMRRYVDGRSDYHELQCSFGNCILTLIVALVFFPVQTTSLLRAVQLELDDMVLASIAARGTSPARSGGAGGASDVSDEDEADLPPDAPSEDQMGLPFASIQEEFESSLRQKFVLLRAALEQTHVAS